MPRQALRRALLLVAAAAALKPLQRRAALGGLTSAALAQTPLSARADELSFSKARNGLEYADAKVGSGSPFRTGQRVAVDYVMSTTGARYGSKIDATKDRNEPYSWVLGDGTTILGLAQCILIFRRIIGSARLTGTLRTGLEQAILGGDGVPPMLPGGVRRLIVPAELAYIDKARPAKNSLQVQDCEKGRGPVPPNMPERAGDMGAGEYQRFKNIYCNPNRPYQPDLVLDVRLFGRKGG